MNNTVFDEKAKKQELFDVLMREFDKSRTEGEDSLQLFFTTTAYFLGSMIPVTVQEQSYMPALAGVIEDITNGMETGIQVVGARGTFVKIVKH
ncbi:hypothetical protein ACM1RC_25975 [Paenibacillus azoreducens]|uniref:hypothetical protein n=1 Tax=Paenibacillus azoreducens TaxID=116718 RepID=UPI0039F57EAD